MDLLRKLLLEMAKQGGNYALISTVDIAHLERGADSIIDVLSVISSDTDSIIAERQTKVIRMGTTITIKGQQTITSSIVEKKDGRNMKKIIISKLTMERTKGNLGPKQCRKG